VRGTESDEHRAAFGGRGTAVAQVLGHRFAHVDRQRQPLDPIALAEDGEFPSAPIDIVQP
jgi:hypothetical protein